MSNETLTDRQKSVFLFIKNKISKRGYGPTVREIAEEFKIKSPNGVVCHLKALVKKGLIRRAAHKSRAIELIKSAPQPDEGLPLVGMVAAGVLHDTVAQERSIDFTQLFNNKNRYVLQIQGESMIDAHIQDGDYVVVEPCHEASNGEIVVAQTEDGSATMKYWFKEKKRIRLQPANKKMKPMYFRDVKVLGVVVGVVRTL